MIAEVTQQSGAAPEFPMQEPRSLDDIAPAFSTARGTPSCEEPCYPSARSEETNSHVTSATAQEAFNTLPLSADQKGE